MEDRTMKRIYQINILIVLLLISSMLNAQTIESFVIAPPQNYIAGIKNIAFLDFENFNQDSYYRTYGGSAFVNYLTAEFLDERRGIYNLSGGLFARPKEGKTYIHSNSINRFKIIEREELNKVLQEKNLGANITLSDNQAAEVGKVLGIDAFITGTIKYDYNSSRTYSTYKDGSVVYTTENKCTTEITVKLLSVANAQVMATKSFSYTSSDKQWGSNEGKVLTFEQLAPINLKVIALQIAAYFSPYYYYVKEDFGKIKVSEFKDKVKNVSSYLENGDLISAYAVYKAIYDADNYNAVAANNIAILYFITGDYEEAVKWWDIASQIDSKGYGKIYEAAKPWVDYGKILSAMGIVIEKYNFTTNTDALAEKIHTKGNKSDRFEVYENPDKNSTIVVKVPGDTEFIVVSKNGNFVKIKLLGGREGYINKDSFK